MRTPMRISVTPTPARMISARSWAVTRAPARTGLTWRPRLLRMIATEMMTGTAEGREAAAAAALWPPAGGTGTGTTSLPRRASTGRQRRRAGTGRGTGRERGAAPPTTRVQRRSLVATREQREDCAASILVLYRRPSVTFVLPP